MKTINKIWPIVAALLTVLGALIFTLALSLQRWDIKKLSNDKLVENTREINDNFENLSININTADIKFLPSETQNTQIICKEYEKEIHTIEVTDNTLKICVNDQRHWTDYISFFSFETPKIMVYLPKEEYLSLKIDTDTGDVEIPKNFNFMDINIKGSTADVKCLASAEKGIKIALSTGDIFLSEIDAENLDLAVSTGDIIAQSINCSGNIAAKVTTGKTNFKNVTCKNLVSEGDTGDMSLKDVLAEGKFDIVRDTGDIKLTDCDAAEIKIETDTGDIRGTLKTPKIFLTATNTGRVDIPESIEGGKCKLTTDTGDIKIMIK